MLEENAKRNLQIFLVVYKCQILCAESQYGFKRIILHVLNILIQTDANFLLFDLSFERGFLCCNLQLLNQRIFARTQLLSFLDSDFTIAVLFQCAT